MSSPSIRPPAVAGQFYPDDPDRLQADVRRYLNGADAPEDCLDPPFVKAIIAPHAGYPYSGPIAASAYVQLACSDIPAKRFVLVGPAHYAPVHGLGVSGAAAFETPLGPAPVDEASRAAVLALPFADVTDAAHAPEHSLEVQLPFLQELFLDFAIVPLLVGAATPPTQVAEALEALWGGPETRIVISSDLSHFYDHETAQMLDESTADVIVTLRPEALREDSACGRVAIAGLLLAARRRGMSARLIDLRNSGDTGGPRQRVVGYGAFIFTEETPAAF
jgi:AmmeMemoRadiSam system protein B